MTNPQKFLTLSIRHCPRGWLKDEAYANMFCILVTLSTRQQKSGWSNDEAPSNIATMDVTPEVSHAPMSSLKDAAAVLYM